MFPPTVAVKAILEPSGEKYGSVSTPGVEVRRRAGAAVSRRHPEVAGVLERDGFATDRWMAKQTCSLPRQRGRRGESEAGDRRSRE